MDTSEDNRDHTAKDDETEQTESQEGTTAADAGAMPRPKATRRVKLYKLSEECVWSDQGTGFLYFNFEDSRETVDAASVEEATRAWRNRLVLEDDPLDDAGLRDRTKTLWMTVMAEEPWEERQVLLHAQIEPETHFQRQQKTLVVWYDALTMDDLALSFQAESGCEELWELVQRFGNLRGGKRDTSEKSAQSQGEEEAENGDNEDVVEEEDDDVEAPPAQRRRANLVEPDDELLLSATSPMMMDDFPTELTTENIAGTAPLIACGRMCGLAGWACEHKYAEQLVALFCACEPEHNEETLGGIATAAKSLLLLGCSEITETLLSRENILHCLGMLEYDPDIPAVSRVHHREYLEKETRLQEVVPFQEPEMAEQIKHTFRLQYVRDTAGAVFMDDVALALVDHMVNTNMTTLRNALSSDTGYFTRLSTEMRTLPSGSDTRRNVVLALAEILRFMQGKPWSVGLEDKDAGESNNECVPLFLHASGMDALTLTLKDKAAQTRAAAVRVLSSCFSQQPGLMRTQLMMPESAELRNTLFHMFEHDEDGAVVDAVGDLLCFLGDARVFYAENSLVLDECPTVSNSSYAHFFETEILDHVMGLFSHAKVFVDNRGSCEPHMDIAFQYACELMTAPTISQRVNTEITERSDVLHGAALLLRCRRADHVVLAALRFLRHVLCQTSRANTETIARAGVIPEMLDAYRSHRQRTGMVFSAVLETLEQLCRKNNAPLIRLVMDHFGTLAQNDAALAHIAQLFELNEHSGDGCKIDHEIGKKGNKQISSERSSKNSTKHQHNEFDELLREQQAEEQYFSTEDDNEDDKNENGTHPQGLLMTSSVISLPPLAPPVALPRVADAQDLNTMFDMSEKEKTPTSVLTPSGNAPHFHIGSILSPHHPQTPTTTVPQDNH